LRNFGGFSVIKKLYNIFCVRSGTRSKNNNTPHNYISRVQKKE
jgi:hypothetical protein